MNAVQQEALACFVVFVVLFAAACVSGEYALLAGAGAVSLLMGLNLLRQDIAIRRRRDRS